MPVSDSRLVNGFVTILHKGKKIPTSVGSKSYEDTFNGTFPSSLVGLSSKEIPFGYEHRPELISNLFHRKPSMWWKVCETNNIFDVFEQLNSGDGIYLP